MSNEKLNRYKELYSEYVAHLVNVHNYHQVFAEHVGLGSGIEVRNSLLKMASLCKDLRKASNEAYKEHVENTKEQRKRLKEIRANAKPRIVPKGKRDKKL